MEAKASLQTSPEQEAVLDQIKSGQVRAIFVDLDGTLIDSTLRLETMSEILKGLGFPRGLVGPEQLSKSAQKAGSFAFKKIWTQHLADTPALRGILNMRGTDLGKFGKFLERRCLGKFSLTLRSYVQNPNAHKKEISELAATGVLEFLHEARKNNIAVVACTNAEIPIVAHLTKRIVETYAKIRFADVMFNDRIVPSEKLEATELGQAILTDKTANTTGEIKLGGKPTADMLIMASLRVAMFRATGKEELLRRNSESSEKDKPVFLFVGDQKADYEAAKALQNVFDKLGIGCTVKFVAVTGTGGTEAEMQRREAEWTKMGVTHFRTLDPMAGALHGARTKGSLQITEPSRPDVKGTATEDHKNAL